MNKISTTGILFFVYLFLFFSLSCNQEIISVKKKPSSFVDFFDDFWNGMNVNYVYWDIDTTDWDLVYKKYKPIFAKLDINNNSDILVSVSCFRAITKDLVDSHYTISFEITPIYDSVISPALERKKKTNLSYFLIITFK